MARRSGSGAWTASSPPARPSGSRASVRSSRATIGRLLVALGEPWDERCLAFHELGNTVKTASVWQVRQPFYSSSVGRWRRFRDAFAAMLGTCNDDPAAPAGDRGWPRLAGRWVLPCSNGPTRPLVGWAPHREVGFGPNPRAQP